MSSGMLPGSMVLKQAIYFGSDEDLKEAVRVSISSKYTMESEDEVPSIWSEGVSLVLIEYDGDSVKTLQRITEVLTLAKGVLIYILLKEKDADFIIEASHHGAQGFIECPNEVFHILSILHMQDRRQKGKNGNVSSMFSLKGGVGCTALGTNIASHLNDLTEGRTVLVDLNMPLGDTALYLNMEAQRLYTLTDFVHNLNRFDENLIYNSLSRHDSGLYVLPLPSEVGELDNLNGELIRTVIQSLRRYYDHVIIDCASDLSDLTLSCLDESDNIVLVAEPSLSSFRAVNTAIQISQKLGYIRESLKLIMNRSTSHGDEMLQEVIDALKLDTVARVDNDYLGFNESLREGKLLKEFKPDSPVNQQLLSIANMLHNGSLQLESINHKTSGSQAGGFLQRLFSKKSAQVKPDVSVKNNRKLKGKVEHKVVVS